MFRNNVNVAADPSSNSLIVTTTPDAIDELRQIIEKLDTVPNQVMIEVIIAEASVNASQKLGFQFDASGVGKLFGTPITQQGNMNFPLGSGGTVATNIASPISPGVQYGIQSEKFNALVQALNTDNRVHVLSTPRVFTANNQEAEVAVTTRVPYATSSYTGGLTIGSSVTYDWLDVGITLDVTPRITAEGLVTIDVVATASELLGFDTLQSSVDSNGHATSILAPRTSDRTTDTSVTVRDGEIVALSGLMRDSRNTQVNKVPLLGDIPIIGSLFRSTTTSTEKTELMIFMVPHVIAGDAASRRMTEEVSKNVRRLVPELEKERPELKPRRQKAPEDQNGPAPAGQTNPPQGGQGNPPAKP
jgi:general secretion pathway protein D